MGLTVVQKIAAAHVTAGPDRPLRDGDIVSLRPRHVLTHDNTAAVLRKFASLGAERIFDPGQPIFALDHDIQNTGRENQTRYAAIEAFAREHGIRFHPAGMGIGHQLMVERGWVVPGSLVVASDSHANTYGALGALGTPVVRTDAAAIWATGEFWWQIPRTVQVVLEGRLPPGSSGKDLILTLCALYRNGEVLNAAVEFAGPGVASLDMAARFTVANMTTEWGALVGWFPVDDMTLRYLGARKILLESSGVGRITQVDMDRWVKSPPAPDADAGYAGRITLDLSRIAPQVSGPDAVAASRSVWDVEAEGIAIQKAYLLSCVNARLEDLEAAAAVLENRRVADGVSLYVAAASASVQREAEESGAWGTLKAAGAKVLPPGCGACIGLGEGLLEPGEVGISATNRNFRGRMGSRDARTYLASPAVVAASAAAGRIVAPPEATHPLFPPDYAFEAFEPPELPAERVAVRPGFPEHLEGRLVFVAKDDLDTDGIYGKDYTYRDLTRDEMARVVMANHDPAFAGRVRRGDVVVGGRNFGTGSSREQAATALQAAGVELVVAASFSQTYLRNAFNNGLPCIECPALVRHLGAMRAEDPEAATPTWIPGGTVRVDFAGGTLTWDGRAYRFLPLGRVAQDLVAAGGIENLLRRSVGARGGAAPDAND